MHGTITRTDGTTLYYETRGAGEPVLILQGGVSDAGATVQLVEELAQHHLVVTYDRRGLSRSASGSTPVTMDTHADDAAAVLEAVTTVPAVLVGASIGALIGLHLGARYPQHVALVIAHEPPMATMVHDPAREQTHDEIAALAQNDVVAAIKQMATLTDTGTTTPEPGAQPGEPAGDLRANLTTFFRHDFLAVRTSPLEATDLRAAIDPARIVLTGGHDSRGQWEHQCAQALAEHLGQPLHELPGGHNGLTTHPWAIARAVRAWAQETA